MRIKHLSAHFRWLAILSIGGLLLALVALPQGATARDSLIKQAAQGKLRGSQFRTPAGIKRNLPTLSAGAVAAAQGALGEGEGGLRDMREEEADAGTSVDPNIIGVDNNSLGCSKRVSRDDTRVNQDCGFRRQAEELIKVNPTDPKNLIAGQNDSRIGYNHCGFDYSFDGGKTWGDGVPSTFQRLNSPKVGGESTGVNTLAGDEGTLHTYDAASDPALTFDSRGQAFYSCILFDVFTNASGLYVIPSPTVAGGSFYNNIPPTGPRYMVVEDNSANFFHDKNFITADTYASSPYRDNVYVTWTVFEFSEDASRCPVGYCGSTIYFSKSTDHATTWSTPTEISGNNPNLCFFADFLNTSRDPSDCTFDQGSDPIVRPDGSIVVIFNNGNTPEGNPNGQQLGVVSRDGGATWSRPTKVGNDVIVNQPTCDFGRGPEECIPGAYIRTNDFPRIAVDKANGDVYATWQDYRFGAFNIVLSKSTDGGLTWTEGSQRVNPSTNLDHYMPAIDVGDNHQVAVSYYRTERIPNENTVPADGFTPGRNPGVQQKNSDVFLAGGGNLNGGFGDTRVAAAFPPPDGNQTGFNGDYMGLVAIGNEALPIWSDTRNTALTDQGVLHDEDVFVDRITIPSGYESDEHGDGSGQPGGSSPGNAAPTLGRMLYLPLITR